MRDPEGRFYVARHSRTWAIRDGALELLRLRRRRTGSSACRRSRAIPGSTRCAARRSSAAIAPPCRDAPPPGGDQLPHRRRGSHARHCAPGLISGHRPTLARSLRSSTIPVAQRGHSLRRSARSVVGMTLHTLRDAGAIAGPAGAGRTAARSLCNLSLRTASGPEGSSAKQILTCAAGSPGRGRTHRIAEC